MITVTTINTLVVFFAYIARHKSMEFFLKLAFTLIFLLLALRYNYGNDYPAYLKDFIEINKYFTINFFDSDWHYEPGWLFLCRLFKPIGFFGMIAVLSFFNCFVYYKFIKKYVPPGYYWFAVFTYVFCTDLMLVHSSAMRQSISIAMFLVSIDYIYKKKLFQYSLCIAIATLFHTSALILFPVYFIGLYNYKINNILVVSLVLIYLSMFLFGGFLISKLNPLISSGFDRYEFYQQNSGDVGSGLGVILYICLFVLVLYYAMSQFDKNLILFKMLIIGFLILPLGLKLQMLYRMWMYFQPVAMVVYPIIALNFKKNIYRKCFLMVLVVTTVLTYISFFNSKLYMKPFGTYQTIFTSPVIY